ncbi:Uncharacterized protein TPAR_04996 [Tolypocladium paradoxum]|uniref:Cytochrome P450 n=1 Tax=Tolypocladium paradoxum TaxID=94208 RepID=A0A2S4KX88_9HYPO|nr:Uncharacterized protein TPAR_04996 [Tolypocladium paradoxum]
MGNQVIFTRDASNIRQMLVNQWSNYDAAQGICTRMFQHLAPRAIAAADGRCWTVLRNMWRTQFISLDNCFHIESEELASLQQSLFVDLMTDLMGDVVWGPSGLPMSRSVTREETLWGMSRGRFRQDGKDWRTAGGKGVRV